MALREACVIPHKVVSWGGWRQGVDHGPLGGPCTGREHSCLFLCNEIELISLLWHRAGEPGFSKMLSYLILCNVIMAQLEWKKEIFLRHSWSFQGLRSVHSALKSV